MARMLLNHSIRNPLSFFLIFFLIFSVFIFSIPSESVNDMFWSMIVFLGSSQWHYNLRLTERAKMTLSRAILLNHSIRNPLSFLLIFFLIFSVFIFWIPSESVNDMFWSMIVFLGSSQWHYNLRLTERAKMTLSRAQNIWTRELSEKKAAETSDTPNFQMCS